MRVHDVRFDRRKYGRHLLIDVAWVHELTGFLIGIPHALRFFDVTFVTRGTGRFHLDGQMHVVRPGTIFFSRPGQVRLWDTKELDGICLFFEDFFVTEFLHDEAFVARLPFFHADDDGAALALGPSFGRRFRARLVAMRRELAHYRRDSLDLLRAQLHETLVVLAREYARVHQVAPQRATHPVVQRFLALVERDATHRRRVGDYASELAVTPGHLSVLCSEYLGARAKRVIDKAIVNRAQRLLLYGDESVVQIGTSLGFADASYFSRFFRRETGQAPTALRRRKLSS